MLTTASQSSSMSESANSDANHLLALATGLRLGPSES